MSDEGFELQRIPGRGEAPPQRRSHTASIVPSDTYVDGYGYGQGYEQSYEAEEGPDIRGIFREILNSALKHKWLILILIIVVPPIVFVEASRSRPTYTAFSDIEIRRDVSVMSPTTSDADPQNMVVINTKKLMFDSRLLLQNVVLNYKLNENPRFLDVSLKRPRWEVIKSLFSKDTPTSQPPIQSGVSTAINVSAQPADISATTQTQNPLSEGELDGYIAVLKRGKSVDQIRDTQALRVSFTHTDPEIAQLVADGLTACFIQSNLDSKLYKFKATSQWLDTVTGQLEGQVQQAEQELNRFTREHGIFSFDEPGAGSLTGMKLKRLQDQIGQIDRDLMTKELIVNEIRQNRVAQLPQVVSDARIARFQSSLDDLIRDEAKLSQDYGDDHPKIKEVRQQIAQVRSQLDGSIKEVEMRIMTDYQRAKSEREQLEAQLEKTRSETVEKDQSALSYSLLKQKLENTKAVYLDFLQKKQQTGLDAAQQRSNIIVLRPAELPMSQDGANPLYMTLFGFGAALFGGLGLAYFIDRFDTTVRSAGDISRYAQLPTLGLIPAIKSGSKNKVNLLTKKKSEGPPSISANETGGKNPQTGGFSHRFRRSIGDTKSQDSNGADPLESGSDRVILVDDLSPVAEAYRVLRTSVLLSTGGSPPKTMLFTSGQPGEGKTTTVINTAISLAHLGASVLIIDADLRKPATHKGFNIKQSHGLSTYLSRDADLNGLIQTLPIPNLHLLPCGPILPNPAELISSEKMKAMLKLLADKYDHILIDSPPLTYVTDPVILSTLVDGVVLVVHGGKSRREIVRLSRQMLDNVGARVFGVVLNNMQPNHLSSSELGYFKYYSYYSEQQRTEERVSEILRGS